LRLQQTCAGHPGISPFDPKRAWAASTASFHLDVSCPNYIAPCPWRHNRFQSSCRHASAVLSRTLLTRSGRTSIRVDVCRADDAAELVILFVNKRAKIRPARANRVEALGDKCRLGLGQLHRRGEPAGELGDRFLRRFRRRDQPKPDLRREVRKPDSATVVRPAAVQSAPADHLYIVADAAAESGSLHRGR
jgi:hypothetical protein